VKCAIYVRVSKSDQDADTQLEYLKGYAALRGWEVVNVYVDEGSGLTTDRCSYKDMVKAIDKGWNKFEIVLFKEISRLGRDSEILNKLIKFFDDHDIKMVSATQPIDTTTAAGKFAFRILCAAAEFESDMISERTKDALAERRKLGKGKRGPDKKPRKKGVDQLGKNNSLSKSKK